MAGSNLRCSAFPSQIHGPIVHQPTSPLEQVRAPVDSLNLFLNHVRQRRLDPRWWSVHSAAQSRNYDGNAFGTVAIPCCRSSSPAWMAAGTGET